jgi:acyl-CoA synthetase (AMP-forming)/AMP-acid ligase II
MASHDYNLACDLRDAAARHPEKAAVICAAGRDGKGRALYRSWTFAKLWRETRSTAAVLREHGVTQGARVLIFMKPSLEFTAVVFALQTLGAVPVLIDPGIGLKRLLICIREAETSVMIGIPKAHLLRLLFPAYFRSVRHSIVAGNSWLAAKGVLRSAGRSYDPELVEPAGGDPDDPGAILFTSGSTGIPKGVELLRRHIAAQKRAWNAAFELREDDIDLVTFPIFLLLSTASGRTCVIPEMDFSQPIKVDPVKFAQAVADHAPTFCFGSPALWNKLSRYAVRQSEVWHTLRRVVIGGAPVAPEILERLRTIAPQARSFTPFGSTEALPICNMAAQEILNVTQYGSHAGRGTCVGFPVPGVTIRIIAVDDAALPDWSGAKHVAPGTIGEIAVSGDVVTESYFRRDAQTRLSKSFELDPQSGVRRVWHRMGDAGYIDEQGRLWFCGRIRHIAWHAGRPYYSVQVEGIFNRLQQVARSALVNVQRSQSPELALIIEPDGKLDRAGWAALVAKARELAGLYGVPIHHYVRHDDPFPVDRRHNAKIEREKLAAWTQRHLERVACAASTKFLCAAVAEQDKIMRRV